MNDKRPADHPDGMVSMTEDGEYFSTHIGNIGSNDDDHDEGDTTRTCDCFGCYEDDE